MIRFDCHAHVYEALTAASGARYVPAGPAPLSDWLAHGARHDIAGGVLVQVSFLGFDNSELCAALSKLDRRRFAGIAVVPFDVSEAELDRLAASGVRGMRWNLVRGAALPDFGATTVGRHLEHLRRRGLHVEIQLESPRLPLVVAPLLDRGLTVVVDHFGLPGEHEPAPPSWLHTRSAATAAERLYVKFSGAYRSPVEIAPHARALLDALPANHVVWGSDWPHTQHEDRIDYDRAVAERGAWPEFSDALAARNLYGIEPA